MKNCSRIIIEYLFWVNIKVYHIKLDWPMWSKITCGTFEWFFGLNLKWTAAVLCFLLPTGFSNHKFQTIIEGWKCIITVYLCGEHGNLCKAAFWNVGVYGIMCGWVRGVSWNIDYLCTLCRKQGLYNKDPILIGPKNTVTYPQLQFEILIEFHKRSTLWASTFYYWFIV